MLNGAKGMLAVPGGIGKEHYEAALLMLQNFDVLTRLESINEELIRDHVGFTHICHMSTCAID